jgi:ligand-binding sensor domain-containing protein/serine phosphatase RsbU (regulator of sigma subunit)
MKSFVLQIIRNSAIVCLFLFSGSSYGQTFRFKNYKVENGLPSGVVYTVNQDDKGYLWVGSTEGLSRFDGFNFFRVQFPDSSSGRYTTVSVKDKNGSLWFGCNDGSLFYTSGRILKQVILPNSSGTGISSILQGPDGKIYVIAQHKPVYRINPEKPSEVEIIAFRPDPNIFSAAFTGSGDMLVGTRENIMICRIAGDSLTTIGTVEGFDYSSVMGINRIDNNSFIIGTDGNGLFRLRLNGDSKFLTRFAGWPRLEALQVKSMLRDSQSNIWVSTQGDGAVKVQFLEKTDSLVSVQILDKASGLAGNNILSVFEDSEKNMWLGFNGEGLSILATDSFEFIAPGGNDKPNNIIFSGKAGNYYLLGTPSGFYIYDLVSKKPLSFTSVPDQAGHREITCYYIDNDENIWIGTNGSGLYRKSRSGGLSMFYRSGDTGADYINGISISGDNIWLASLNGVNIVSRTTNKLKKVYDISNGLPAKGINQILPMKDGSCYIATESDRLFRIYPDSGVSASDASMYGMLLNKILAMTKDSKGIIWAATLGNGIFACYPDSVKPINTANGLLNNYTYSILADREDNIWVGHERGISRYDQKTGIVKVFGTDFARDGKCNENGLYEAPDGKILIGTTEGLIIYDPAKDRKNVDSPVNNINSISVNNVEYPFQSSFSFPYKKRYNVKVSYIGINFHNPEKVYYSTYLENYDDDWTKLSPSREVSYNLRDGKYKFNLVSVNEDGLTQENPLTFEINIKPPVWRAWWFIISCMVLAAGAVVVIIREREKAQKKVQEYLENELEARTKVVRDQKAVLELQNLEITDSINYARRIQSSILPDVKRLKEQFNGAFIMLDPRDIVSGDFYWFDKLDDDRFILVCADSTGHGVPGAFMSMIGTTLLQDIVTRQRISKPSEILTMLDKEIFSTLNQNLELGVSNDGMDIVVCEFTLKNKHIRFASAMRPVIIVMGGEIYYIKGNRASVGGQTVLEKYFDDQEYYLNEGDSIYLFSDGFPDQFGGPDGKKMKVARLKTFISEISGLPVDRQEEALTKFFKDWKGDYEQVDDVLFMGMKI